ncbi:cell division protein FtsZ [Candidatus Woesearchaeota archaeon]|nr:cell division protein FtsZ [Candidatus Woesearchaeota archaeon]
MLDNFTQESYDFENEGADDIQIDEARDDRPAFVSEPVREPVREPTRETIPDSHVFQSPVKGSVKDAIDAELEALLTKQMARIKVVGVGGAGNNTINRITEIGVKGAEIIAVNTDAQDLLYANAKRKILIGKEITSGLGAGSQPKIGEEAAKEDESEIKKALQDSDLVFVTCGLGGGTGTGAAPVIAEVAKKLGALVVGVVTLPFAMEGQRRYENAVVGLEKMENTVDTLIVIPNDKLLELAPDLPLQTAFKVVDEILANSVKGIAELITKAGLVNLDFADIRTVMGKGGVALIGVGESDSDNRAVEAVEKAINNPLLDVDISGASGALINICGGPDLTLEEARTIVETISDKLDPDAKVIWGAQISEDLNETVRTLLIVTGVRSTQIFGPESKISGQKKKEMEEELGIDFID